MSSAGNEIMSRNEREDLQRLIRQREKVLKSAAKTEISRTIGRFRKPDGQ